MELVSQCSHPSGCSFGKKDLYTQVWNLLQATENSYYCFLQSYMSTLESSFGRVSWAISQGLCEYLQWVGCPVFQTLHGNTWRDTDITKELLSSDLLHSLHSWASQTGHCLSSVPCKTLPRPSSQPDLQARWKCALLPPCPKFVQADSSELTGCLVNKNKVSACFLSYSVNARKVLWLSRDS